MNDGNEAVALAGGVGGALFLGIALIPFRGLTPAANFTFAFMALTIVIAEVGGRRAAVVTALTSALSLDFFLTEPYLKLTIAGKDDIVAFVGLTICGLIAAAFGTGRDTLKASAGYLGLLEMALARLEEGGVRGQGLGEVLDRARMALPVSALLVRDAAGQVVQATAGAANLTAPFEVLDAEILSHPGSGPALGGVAGGPLPSEGLRLALRNQRGRFGTLDIWGDGRPASVEARRVLLALSRTLTAKLSLGSGGDEETRRATA